MSFYDIGAAASQQVLSSKMCIRDRILNEHKIVIGSTEFDYDAMTVTTDKESLVSVSYTHLRIKDKIGMFHEI